MPPESASACITNFAVKSGVPLVPSHICQFSGMSEIAPDQRTIVPIGVAFCDETNACLASSKASIDKLLSEKSMCVGMLTAEGNPIGSGVLTLTGDP